MSKPEDVAVAASTPAQSGPAADVDIPGRA